MKRWRGVLGLVLVGLLTAACDDGLPTLADCPEVADVEISATNVDGQRIGSMDVDEQARLDLTPLDVWGSPVPRGCHATRVQWRLDPPGLAEAVGQLTGFNPVIVATAPGTLTISGCVEATCGAYRLLIR